MFVIQKTLSSGKRRLHRFSRFPPHPIQPKQIECSRAKAKEVHAIYRKEKPQQASRQAAA